MDLKQYNLSYELCCNNFDFIMTEINRVGFARQGQLTDMTKFKKIFLNSNSQFDHKSETYFP